MCPTGANGRAGGVLLEGFSLLAFSLLRRTCCPAHFHCPLLPFVQPQGAHLPGLLPRPRQAAKLYSSCCSLVCHTDLGKLPNFVVHAGCPSPWSTAPTSPSWTAATRSCSTPTAGGCCPPCWPSGCDTTQPFCQAGRLTTLTENNEASSPHPLPHQARLPCSSLHSSLPAATRCQTTQTGAPPDCPCWTEA